jgi:hypothetical protein
VNNVTKSQASISMPKGITALSSLLLAALAALFVFVPLADAASTRSELPALSNVGATGTGDVTTGSSKITNVTTSTGAFKAGQTISGTGLPASAVISAVEPGTIELSVVATATNVSVNLTANSFNRPCGAATDAFGDLYVSEGASKFKIYSPGGTLLTEFLGAGFHCSLAVDSSGEIFAATTPVGGLNKYKPSEYPPTAARGSGDLSAGSNQITNITTSSGTFNVGQLIKGIGVPANAKITAVGAGTLTLSANATVSGSSVPLISGTAYATDGSLPIASGSAVAVAVDPKTQHIFVAEAIKEQQAAAFSGMATGDTFTLGNLPASCSDSTTAEITYNLTSGTRNNNIKAALEAKCGVNFAVAGTTVATITFQGKYAGMDVGQLTCTASSGSCSLSTTVEGDGRISSYEANGTVLSNTIGTGVADAVYTGVDVYGATGRVYAVDKAHNKAYIFDPTGATVLKEVDGSESPTGAFVGMETAALAVDQSNGNFLVSDIKGHGVVDEFSAGGKYIDQISHTPAFVEANPSDIAVDSSASSAKGNVYVTSGAGIGGSSYAYGPLSPTPKLSVTKSGTGAGTVTSSLNGLTDEGIVCGVNCEQEYAEGEVVTLSATPDGGSTFKEWTGACTGAGTCEVTMSTAKTVNAEFSGAASPPAVTNVNPDEGPAAGGTSVTITGTNLTGATEVKFGTNNATAVNVVSATEVTATSPAGTGTVDVTVTTPAGTSPNTAADDFTYNAAPVPPAVTNVNPDEGPAAGGTSVTITGTNLTGATEVKFGTNNATAVNVVSATEVTATSPAGTGTVDVTVTTPAGTSPNTAADDFTYVAAPAAPAVTALNPTKGPAAGGNQVEITGTNLTDATKVEFGTTAVNAPFAENTATKIKVNAPAHAAGAVDVTVTTAGGTSANTAADNYTYVALPAITGVSPSKGPLAGGNTVTVTGTNLNEATFKFGANSATGVLITGGGTGATMTAPAGAAGTVDVIATTPGGTSANTAADNYTYVAGPSVTALNPTKGPSAGGNQVEITGTNLTDATKVEFGTTTVNAPFAENTATKIKVNAPAHAAGAVDVTVTTAGGTSANTAADNYTYVALPAITGLSPDDGPTAGGNSVTITGTNLNATTGVKFGASNATGFTVDSATQITATAPAGAAGTVDITVTTAGGTSGTSANSKYAYVAPHALTVNKSGSGAGSVTCNGTSCASTYPHGSEVTLAASADAGSTFAGWTGGGCSGTGSCVVTVNGDTAVTATFTANPVPPVGPPAPAPAPPAPEGEGTPKVNGTAPVSGGKASLTIACKGGACQGTLKLTAKIGGKKKAIGSASYSIVAGESKTIKVKLTGAAKKELAKGKTIKAQLSGKGLKGTVKLKPPKKK